MKAILKIARNELRNLFYSPVAWFLAILFLLLCAYIYTSMLYPLSKTSSVLYLNHPEWKFKATRSMTKTIFDNFFANILSNIYLFIPLLTMGVINRENGSGTFRLLYSSPVKLYQIVLGKYLALMVFNLVFVLTLGLIILSAFFDIQALDYGPLLSAIFGIYLFLCALTAIGFFMSSITDYPIVSAISSFTVLFILMSIGKMWQQYPLVRDLTWFLSIKDRTEKMTRGLIRSKDVVYYLVIIVLFMEFTLLRLRAGRETKPWYVRAARYLAITAAGFIVGYWASRPRFTAYWDTTARHTNTLHPESQKVLHKLIDSPLVITFFCNLFDYSQAGAVGLPEKRNQYLEMWEPYVRFKPDIQFNYVYYYALPPGDSTLYRKYPGKTLQQIAGLEARGMQTDIALFHPLDEIQQRNALGSEGYNSVMQVQCGQRTTFLRFLPQPPEDRASHLSPEPDISAALERVAGTPIPGLAFISGGLERSIYKKGEREYWKPALGKAGLNDIHTMGSLINQGFDADTLNPDSQDIPDGLTALILADPKMDLSAAALAKLKGWIGKGGNMLILGEPGKQYILNPLLQRLGIQLRQGQLIRPTRNETADRVPSWFTAPGLSLAEEFWFLKYKYLWENNVYDDSLRTMMAGVTALTSTGDSGFVVQSIARTIPGSTWLKAGKLVVDSAAPVFNRQEGDVWDSSFPTIVRLTRKMGSREQRIIVCGDADMLSNSNPDEGLLIRAYCSWLSDSRFPVYTPFPYAQDNKIILSPRWASGQKIVYLWILPGILLLAGTVILIRRRRK